MGASGDGVRPASRADPVGALEHAFRLAPREYPRLLLWWSLAFLVEVVVGLLVGVYASRAGLLGPANTLTTTDQMRFLGVAVPLYLALFTLRLALWTVAAARVLRASGQELPARRWQDVVGPALLMGFVLTLTYAAGVMLVVVGFFVFVHWFLYAPSFLAKGDGSVGAAFEQSRRFARERGTAGFTALILFIGAPILVLYAWTGSLGGLAGVIIPAAVAWLFGPLVPILAASFVAVAEGRPKAATRRATPAARATTSCPRCLELIPYDPSEGATSVICPSCGHSGRVH